MTGLFRPTRHKFVLKNLTLAAAIAALVRSGFVVVNWNNSLSESTIEGFIFLLVSRGTDILSTWSDN